MHTLTLMARNYNHILNLVKYGCIFLFFTQFVVILLISQLSLAFPLEDNIIFIAIGLGLSAIATTIFYVVSMVYLKYSLKEVQIKRRREMDKRSKEVYS